MFCFFFGQENEDDQIVADLAVVLLETATLRSGYLLPDTKEYGERIERMLRLSLNIDPEEKVSEDQILQYKSHQPFHTGGLDGKGTGGNFAFANRAVCTCIALAAPFTQVLAAIGANRLHNLHGISSLICTGCSCHLC